MAYDDLLKIRTWSNDASKTEHITNRVKSLIWSGNYKDCARKLSFDVLAGALVEIGGMARLYNEADILFSGHVRRCSRDTRQQIISCTAYDRGVFLKNNSTFMAVRNQTPEDITRQLCGEFGIPVGSIAATGVKVSRNFLGTNLYQIIQTMYTLASEKTGKKYQIRFKSNDLEVVEKAINTESIRLVPGSNLISCKAEDSIENIVTSVAVYSDEFKKVATYDSPENYRALYGLFQTAIKSSSYDDPAAAAKDILQENGYSQTITAVCLGNKKLITGNAVVVHEPVTGADGLFWILSDSHTVTNGIYQTTVTLDFRNLMDKQEAGSVPTT